jgi:hypothetical protein
MARKLMPGGRTPEQFAEYFSQPEDGVVFVRHEEPKPVTVDEMTRMSMDIVKGQDKPPAGSDLVHRSTWERLKAQIDEIHKKGGTVELPFDIP